MNSTPSGLAPHTRPRRGLVRVRRECDERVRPAEGLLPTRFHAPCGNYSPPDRAARDVHRQRTFPPCPKADQLARVARPPPAARRPCAVWTRPQGHGEPTLPSDGASSHAEKFIRQGAAQSPWVRMDDHFRAWMLNGTHHAEVRDPKEPAALLHDFFGVTNVAPGVGTF